MQGLRSSTVVANDLARHFTELYAFFPGLLASAENGTTAEPGALQTRNRKESSKTAQLNGRRSAAHSILAGCGSLQPRPYTFAQTSLLPSLFACNRAADDTFRLGRDPPPHPRTSARGKS